MFWGRSLVVDGAAAHAEGGEGERGEGHQHGHVSSRIRVSICRAHRWNGYILFNSN